MDKIELDGDSVHVPGIYDWYLYFNTYAEWTKHCMDKRFKAKMSHRKGKEPTNTSEGILQLTLPLYQSPI